MSENTVVSLLLTGILVLSLYLCIRKFLSVKGEKTSLNTKELNSRIMKNWLEIYACRNNDDSSIENLSQAFESMDQLHTELLNLGENAEKRRNKAVFLHQVKIESVELTQKS